MPARALPFAKEAWCKIETQQKCYKILILMKGNDINENIMYRTF